MIDSIQKLVALIQQMVTWWFFVEPWETAIRVRAGKHLKTCGPGVHVKVPLLDTVYVHNNRRCVHQVPPSTLSSKDGKVFTVMSAVEFRVRDARLLHETVQDPKNVMNRLLWQATSEYIGAHDSGELSARGMKQALDEVDLEQYGLTDVEACVTNFACVRTYRVIQDGMQTWTDDACVLTTTAKR